MRTRVIASAVALTAVALTGVSACSSGSSSSASSSTTSSAPAATAAPAGVDYTPQPWVLPTPTSSANAKAIWCSALVQVIAKTVPGTETEGELRSRADALVTYRNLWDTARDQGYVTTQEAQVNQSYLDGYIEMTRLKLLRKGDSPEMTKVIDGMNKLTTDSKALFDSSAAKITDFCQLTYGSATPTPTAPAPSAS